MKEFDLCFPDQLPKLGYLVEDRMSPGRGLFDAIFCHLLKAGYIPYGTAVQYTDLAGSTIFPTSDNVVMKIRHYFYKR